MRQIVSLRQIEGFLLACEMKSFTRAAETMQISPSAFSQLIRELEVRLGVRLFDRTTRRIAMTAAGEAMNTRLGKCLEAIDQACEEARSIARVESGHIILGTVSSFAPGLVMRALGRLRRAHPGITVMLKEDLNDDLVARVAQGELDFAVSGHMDVAPQTSFRPLFDDELVVVLPQDHARADAPILRWSDLDGENLVLAFRQSRTYEYIYDKTTSNSVAFGIEYEAANLFTALGMVRAGFGIAFMPRIVTQDISLEGLVAKRIENPPVRRMGLYHQSERGISPAALKFESVLRLEIAETQRRLFVSASEISGAPAAGLLPASL
jgi:DNA-binding transcriptional LysR family regulator